MKREAPHVSTFSDVLGKLVRLDALVVLASNASLEEVRRAEGELRSIRHSASIQGENSCLEELIDTIRTKVDSEDAELESLRDSTQELLWDFSVESFTKCRSPVSFLPYYDDDVYQYEGVSGALGSLHQIRGHVMLVWGGPGQNWSELPEVQAALRLEPFWEAVFARSEEERFDVSPQLQTYAQKWAEASCRANETRLECRRASKYLMSALVHLLNDRCEEDHCRQGIAGKRLTLAEKCPRENWGDPRPLTGDAHFTAPDADFGVITNALKYEASERTSGEVDGPDEQQKDGYWDRWSSFVQTVNPVNMFATRHKIENAILVLQLAEEGNPVPEEEVKKAGLVVSACCNPSSRRLLNPFVRLAAFVPCNVPLVAGFLLSPPGIFWTVFMQWINQTYNALFNLAQANEAGSEETKNERQAILTAYAVAVVSSISLSLGVRPFVASLLTHLLSSSAVPLSRQTLNRAVYLVGTYCGIAGAGAINLILIRFRELVEGIPVSVKAASVGGDFGKSRSAAFRAIAATATTRLASPVIITAFPPAFLFVLGKVLPSSFFSSPPVLLTFELLSCTLALWLALPAALALFPQRCRMKSSFLETEELRRRAVEAAGGGQGSEASESDSAPPLWVYFDKGT
uniref:Sideroflexin n=1 Tax=Chromera velia CCMP2878 TaxID=1169474 RepID=A0A0G4FSS4_9ALVE|eukprot:Cvel_3706.t1-p1 / transcript=Cvel_3706.t1 / gene=Cvel_3706 / organism=Chromera_velia_CCMP2878 / gene_product=Sideroflexin-5, putative / transcript_product=Sideroflexin-5, putative / location=Cvel_scaffold154:53989-59354(-) / protein_length=630 / sequence_SO=supercontig / SO=protein_coding / is_pseudo=false